MYGLLTWPSLPRSLIEMLPGALFEVKLRRLLSIGPPPFRRYAPMAPAPSAAQPQAGMAASGAPAPDIRPPVPPASAPIPVAEPATVMPAPANEPMAVPVKPVANA